MPLFASQPRFTFNSDQINSILSRYDQFKHDLGTVAQTSRNPGLYINPDSPLPFGQLYGEFFNLPGSTSAINHEYNSPFLFDSTINGAIGNFPKWFDRVSDYLPSIFGDDQSASAVSRLPMEPESINYLYADLARHYGMSASSAYQEALSNTAYQRAVKDMKAAGLNPASIFGAGRGSGAGSVSYVSQDGSSGGSFTSAKKSSLFSSDAFGAISALAGLVYAGATKNPANFYKGESSAKVIMSTIDKFSKFFD